MHYSRRNSNLQAIGACYIKLSIIGGKHQWHRAALAGFAGSALALVFLQQFLPDTY